MAAQVTYTAVVEAEALRRLADAAKVLLKAINAMPNYVDTLVSTDPPELHPDYRENQLLVENARLRKEIERLRALTGEASS